MNVTIGDSINCLALFRDKAPENDFISSCIDLAICALKTIQDGNYQLNTDAIPQEILDEIVNYTCTCKECDDCNYFYNGHCLYEDAWALKNQNEYHRRLKDWMKKHSNY